MLNVTANFVFKIIGKLQNEHAEYKKQINCHRNKMTQTIMTKEKENQ